MKNPKNVKAINRAYQTLYPNGIPLELLTHTISSLPEWDVCHNCEHLIYDQDVTGNHFPYCKKYEVGLEPTLMNEHFDWCTDFKEKEGGEK